jgi:osmotically-inducible protein OsmY
MNAKSLVSFFMLLLLGAAWLVAAPKDHPPVTDDTVTDTVRRKLANDPVVKGGAFDVDVKGGVVTMRGKVEMEKQKNRATKIVRKVKGVKSVDNQLTVIGKGAR